MSKALIFAALLAGLPAAAYAQDTRDNPVNAGAAAGAAVGAAATAPLAAAAGIVGGLTGVEAPRFHHYVMEEQIPSTCGRTIRVSSSATCYRRRV
jgi:hypothetical protein